MWTSRTICSRTCSVSSHRLSRFRRVVPQRFELTIVSLLLLPALPSRLAEHIAQNHDLTVRFRWQPGSLAIWDNVRPSSLSLPPSVLASLRCHVSGRLTFSLCFFFFLLLQRSTLHSATNDYGSATREGDRVVSVGEKPYYDPTSLSREAALRGKQD